MRLKFPHSFLSLIFSLALFYEPLKLFSEPFDLNQMAQKFLIEAKQIHIPGYPDAFNPALIRWKDSLLLFFRIRDPLTASTDQVGYVWLDSQFIPCSQPKILEKRFVHTYQPSMAQDPRLVNVNDKLYVVFNNMWKVSKIEERRMYLAEVLDEQDQLYINQPMCCLNIDGKELSGKEKNWVPFVYQDQLLFAYSLFPHHILSPIDQTQNCETLFCTHASCQWKWGIPRGGTPALLVEGEYLAFFHSCLDIATIQSKGEKILHYMIGAYTFSAEPPFHITRISPEPLIHQNLYNGPMHRTWKPLRVAFADGYIVDEKYIWLAYGKQDHETWIAKLDKKELLNSLIVTTN